MSDPTRPKLTLTLDGVVTSGKFVEAVNSFFSLLNNVADSATGKTKAVEWLVTVREGSSNVDAQLIPVNAPPEQVGVILGAVVDGLRSLESGEKTRPKYFSDGAMRAARKLSEVPEEGVFVKIGVAGQLAERISTQIKASVNAVIEASYKDYGSVEGKLVAISGKSGYQFSILDDLTEHEIKCYFDTKSHPIRDLFDAWERRVSVRGQVHYRKDGTPVSIQVDEIRVFRANDQLPPLSAITGLFKDS